MSSETIMNGLYRNGNVLSKKQLGFLRCKITTGSALKFNNKCTQVGK